MNQETMNIIITVVVIPLLTAISGLLIALIKAKAQEIAERVKDERLAKYIALAEDTVEKSVATVFQTYVDTLKKNGSFKMVEQQEAFNLAKKRILLMLTQESREAIELLYDDLDKWIETSIEHQIAINKPI